MADNFRERLFVLLNDVKSPASRRVGWLIQSLIFVSLISFSVQSVPDLPSAWRSVLNGLELLILATFTIEYAARIYAARPRRSYVLSWLGVIDLLALLPSLVGLAGFGSLRALRLVRALRLLKLVRYNRALDRLRRAFANAREELAVFGLVVAIVVYLAAVGIYACEQEVQPERFGSIPQSLWWAIVTLTTVGYGDTYPITAAGRVFTAMVLCAGLGVVAIPSGIIASSLTQVIAEEKQTSSQHNNQAHNG